MEEKKKKKEENKKRTKIEEWLIEGAFRVFKYDFFDFALFCTSSFIMNGLHC